MSEYGVQRSKISILWWGIHLVIIVNFLMEIFYASYMVFYVIVPKGISGPLWAGAAKIPHELMVTRRLYAIEAWIAITGLAIYLAITELGPRMWLKNKS